MSVFTVQNRTGYLNEEVLHDYVDVYFHCENNSIVEGHMAIIAPLSPFCHRFFKSRKNMSVVDMFFPQIKQSVIEQAVNVVYGKQVNVEKSDVKRVSSFLNILQVKYNTDECIQDDSIVKISSEQEKNDVSVEEVVVQRKTFSDNVYMEIENTLHESNSNVNIEIRENDEHDHQGSSATQNMEPTSGPSINKYNFNDHLDDWTITTTDDEKLDDIEHTIVRGEGRKRYKCKLCKTISKEFDHAVRHFKTHHQDLKMVSDVLSSEERRRSDLKDDFHNLTKAGLEGVLMEHECSETIKKFQILISQLEGLPKCLPIPVEKKKREFIKKLKIDVNSVQIFSNNL